MGRASESGRVHWKISNSRGKRFPHIKSFYRTRQSAISCRVRRNFFNCSITKKTDQFQLPGSSFAKIIDNLPRTKISIWQIYGANLSGEVASNLTSKRTQLTKFSRTKRWCIYKLWHRACNWLSEIIFGSGKRKIFRYQQQSNIYHQAYIGTGRCGEWGSYDRLITYRTWGCTSRRIICYKQGCTDLWTPHWSCGSADRWITHSAKILRRTGNPQKRQEPAISIRTYGKWGRWYPG